MMRAIPISLRHHKWGRFLAPLVMAVLLSGCIHELEKVKGKAPPIPTNVQVLGLDGAVQIMWDTPPVNVPHNLYWSVDGGPEEVIENISPPYFHQGLQNGSLYTYQLTATNRAGESPRTAPVSAMPVVFNWQENWVIPVDQGNNPQCNDDGTSPQCIIISNDNNNWYASRFFSGADADVTLGEPLTYIKLFDNFDMRYNGLDYAMESADGLNMTVELMRESSVEARGINIPVRAYRDLYVRAFEAVLPGSAEYAYLEIQPANLIPGDACNGVKLRYVFAKAIDRNTPVQAPDSTVKIIELDDPGEFFRRSLMPDLSCAEDEYVIGAIRLGIEDLRSDFNWVRWQSIAIVGPPLP